MQTNSPRYKQFTVTLGLFILAMLFIIALKVSNVEGATPKQASAAKVISSSVIVPAITNAETTYEYTSVQRFSSIFVPGPGETPEVLPSAIFRDDLTSTGVGSVTLVFAAPPPTQDGRQPTELAVRLALKDEIYEQPERDIFTDAGTVVVQLPTEGSVVVEFTGLNVGASGAYVDPIWVGRRAQ